MGVNERRGLRDLVVIGVGAVLLALAQSAGDFGVPLAAVPFVSAAAMYAYRYLRRWRGREDRSIDAG